MVNLTCGERLIRCLTGQPVDRIPFGVGLGWAGWGETHERWRRESGNADLNPAQVLHYDPGFAVPKLQLGIFPGFPEITVSETAEFIVQRNERGILLRQRRDHGSMPEFMDYPVKTRYDWDQLKAERLNPLHPGRIAENMTAFNNRIRQTGQAVQVGVFPYGVFGTVRDLMGVEAMLVAFYDEPEMVHNMMDHLTTLWLTVWEEVARQTRIDHIHIWEDMSGRQGSLISPAMAESFMMPCYDRIAAFAKTHHIPLVSVDTDGDCSELVPLMMRHGINAFLPFEVQAGNDINEYRRLYPELGIFFGLDKRALAEGKAAIDREVGKAAAMIQKGRYIPGFDHLIPPDVPWANFCYAAKRIRNICGTP